jgi:hypothetical protein
MRRRMVMTSLLMLGLWSLRDESTVFAQAARDADAPGRTQTRSVLEAPSIRGAATALSEVVEETVRRDARTTQTTRSAYLPDADGRQQLASVMEEQRITQPDGGHQITREFTDVGIDRQSRTTRRESEQLTARGNGLFVTSIEVTEPSVNGSGFIPTERTEQRERRVGDQVVEREATTTVDPLGRGTWNVLEQRVLTRSVAEGRAESVELISRPDASGKLVQSERVVSKEWAAGGQEFRTDEIYKPDINNGGSLTQRPVQQVEVVRTTLAGGGSDTTRTVSERTGDRFEVIERVIERARPDGRGGQVIEQELQRSIGDGRLQTMSTGRKRESP